MKRVLLLLLLISNISYLFGQVELVPVEHKVYDFLRRMDAKGVIDFNTASIPVSREVVAKQLRIMNNKLSVELNNNDKALLKDFCKEFEFDLKEKVNRPEMTLIKPDFNNNNFVDDNKYVIKFADTNVAVWGHLMGGLYQRNGWGDSLGNKKLSAGDLGFELRGTMYNRVGFSLSYSNGSVLVGNSVDKKFASSYDPFFRTAQNLPDDGKFFDHFRGYIRYEHPDKWLSVFVGKERVKQGFGFIDNLFYSGVIPYPMLKLDLSYKALAYTFSYGNIKGDSMSVLDLPNKMVSTHRLDVRFTKWLRSGFYESVISSNSAFNFEHFNPLSFLISADLNTGGIESYKSNSLLGFDVEVIPFPDFVFQGTLLIDDFNFSSVLKNDSTANDNKFGYQAGVLWNDAFYIGGLSCVLEYTRLDPFTYSHRDNKQQYTNWGYSLGHQLPPNSDEIALRFDYNVLPRLNVNFLMQFQRLGEGFTYDSLGNLVINYGGNINVGVKDLYGIKNRFLQGNRVSRSILGFGVRFEPVRQLVFDMFYKYKFENLIYLNKKGKDHLFWFNLSFKF